MTLGLLANPENRRAHLFLQACSALDHPAPVILAWEKVATDPAQIDTAIRAAGIDLLRIDSPGENAAVAARLIELGGGPANATLQHGEIAFQTELHHGFCHILSQIECLGMPCTNSPAEIAVMFDKWASHTRFAAAGLPRPRSRLAPRQLSELRASRPKHGRVFLKPLHGSSASGVCAYRWKGDLEQLIAPIEIATEDDETRDAPESRVARLFNSLRVRTYGDRAQIDLILGQLLPLGMIEEEWILKAPIDGGRFDLRVLVIAGEARHAVARVSRHPMTNLHLGNQRRDLDAVSEAWGTATVDRCLRLAEAAAACFPNSLSAGVDILVDSRGRPSIGEINAFGDLLPGLLHRNQSPPEAIASAIQSRPHGLGFSMRKGHHNDSHLGTQIQAHS